MLTTRRKGFTLIELLVVLIIIGILATISINQFIGPRESALNKEAIANLKLIAAAERMYRMETGSYVSAATETDLNDKLKLLLPAVNRKWQYAVDAPTKDTFRATAVRADKRLNRTYFVNESLEEPVKQ
ncbi:MAG TPA: prepilin-type N-terminal cleavage/methylation domain-containing protein [Candidatus Omnitrophota bacterium]|nr:prepilin-type N-terminal cleavage/methylation domain-containing protein [Candidatus Omnitrophota bacterium]HRZ15401.1 prepilin-type N-terminal cleavage/methylation domain-containing protein [Candidatus Omnitrophota bacterium]